MNTYENEDEDEDDDNDAGDHPEFLAPAARHSQVATTVFMTHDVSVETYRPYAFSTMSVSRGVHIEYQQHRLTQRATAIRKVFVP